MALAALPYARSPGRRRLGRLLGPDRVLVRPKLDAAFAARARALGADLLVSWFWTNRIPMEAVRAARLGGIGVHPSLLPRHRGPDPTAWTILAGDTVSGVTCHRIEAEYDAGAILAREEIAIGPTWSAWQLARALDRPSLRVLRQVCGRFAAGDPPAETAQDEALATQAPRLTEDQQRIRWTETTVEIERLVRALAPSPGAFTEIGGATISVLRVRPVSAPPWLERAGEGAWFDGRAVVRTADGALELVEAEQDGVPLPSLSGLFGPTSP